MTAPAGLRPRHDPGLAGRIARSAAATEGVSIATRDVPAWIAERMGAHRFRVSRIPLAELDGWSFAPGSGNLVHRSGRFFSIEGLSVDAPAGRWQQPIIVQPEIGILGILAREFDGVLHFLLQAKVEPGNPNLLQLSPTVQATRSNYTKVHRGGNVRYVDYFLERGLGRVLADVLQSEHGEWCHHKSNRNMIIEVDDDVPPHEDYRWFTLGQIGALLRQDDLVNMDARSVLACLPPTPDDADALWSDTDLLSWVTDERSRQEIRAERIPLARVAGWDRDERSIRHRPDRYFRVVGVAVEAGSREVPSWSQPLVEPVATGTVAFLFHRFGGVPHVLAHARAEAGLRDAVELGPTVQVMADGHETPPFLASVLADPAGVRYEAVHSEEGGRFLDAESHYLIVEADEDTASAEPPPGYRWVTPSQLGTLIRHGHYVNVQARSLLAAFNTAAL